MVVLKLASQNQHKSNTAKARVTEVAKTSDLEFLSEDRFQQALFRERRRTERSGRSFLLVLISGEELRGAQGELPLREVVTALSSSIRETDLFGWHEHPNTIGVLMTEIAVPSIEGIESVVRMSLMYI